MNGPGRVQAQRRLLRAVIATVTVLTAAKVYLAGHAELLPEEAYYWSYVQHLALGYFDHPPMVAWIVGVGTTLLGDTELGVRLGTILLSLGSTLLLFLLTRLWFGATAACWAALAFNALPIFIAVGVLAFPDGPLVFFWLLTLYAVSKAIGIGPEKIPIEEMPGRARARATAFWLLAGIAFGGALLSKYTAVLLGASLGLFLLISSVHRHWLRRLQLWLAGVVALLVFSPVIIWNAQHEWASFLFQSTRTVGQQPDVLKTVGTFWLFQLAVLGPLVVLFALAVWRGVQCGWLKREDHWNFAASFSLPLFFIFVLASFKTEVHINWTAPCFLSLLPAVAAIFRDGAENRLRLTASRWRWFGAAVAVLVVCGVGFAFSVTVWGVPSALAPSRSGGWRQIAARVKAQEADLARCTGQKPFVVGSDKYNLSALLGFYNRAPQNQVNNLAFGKHGLGFRYWTDLKSLEGRPAVVVETRLNTGSLRDLTNHFDRVDAAKRVVIPTFGTRTRTVWLIDCYRYHLIPKASQQAAVATNPSSLDMR